MPLWMMFSDLVVIELLALREGRWLGYGTALGYGLIWIPIALGWLVAAHVKMGLSEEKAAIVPALVLSWLIVCTLGRPLLIFEPMKESPKAPPGLAGRVLLSQILLMAGVLVIVVIGSL